MKKRRAKKRILLKLVIVLAVLAAIAAAVFWWSITPKMADIKLGSHTFKATVLTERADLQQGLSGTESLPADELMFFDFGGEYRWGIWMKDMKYDIDVVWLDKDGKVVYMVEDMKPESYPGHYQPEDLSRYVIEGISGTIDRTGIKKGDVVALPPEIKK
jgi:uncharacterized membrane protein (UPF0127 family)